MTVFAVVSWVLEGSNRILLQGPGSIAGKMSLFTDVGVGWKIAVDDAVECMKDWR